MAVSRRRRGPCAGWGVVSVFAAALALLGPPAAKADEFASGRACGYPGYRYDMSKVEAAARRYPNGRILILTPEEKSKLQREFAEWNSRGGRPLREMAPCFNCSPEYEACIVFERESDPRPGTDEFASDGGGPPEDAFASNGDVRRPPGDEDACRKSPQSYTCLYSHPDRRPEPPSLPSGTTYGCPDYHDMDVPGAAPTLRYQVGFLQGVRRCVNNEQTAQNLMLAALAARFKEVAILLQVAAAPGVVDAVLHPPGVARNPNPYLRGLEEGRRLCEWGLKISPVRPVKPALQLHRTYSCAE